MRRPKRRKVLIIKLGITETIGNKVNWKGVSLGDIIRTTVLLHLFRNDDVTWLATKEGRPLLADNPYINKIEVYNPRTDSKLRRKKFDVVINLDKEKDILRLADSIEASKKYGFRPNPQTGRAEAYAQALKALATSEVPILRSKMKDCWDKVLYDIVGARWNGEGYILGYKPKTKEIYDIGFNIHVNKRWKNKAWAFSNWKRLEKLIGNKYSISYQKSLNNIHRYIDWINSCRLLITNDSLGLHLALALKKKIIALFGPTSQKEIYFGNSGVALTPLSNLKCIPCFLTHCKYATRCIDTIKPEIVYENIKRLLGEDKRTFKST